MLAMVLNRLDLHDPVGPVMRTDFFGGKTRLMFSNSRFSPGSAIVSWSRTISSLSVSSRLTLDFWAAVSTSASPWLKPVNRCTTAFHSAIR